MGAGSGRRLLIEPLGAARQQRRRDAVYGAVFSATTCWVAVYGGMSDNLRPCSVLRAL